MMRKFILFTLVLVLVFTFTACGSNNGGTATTAENNSSSAVSSTPSEPPTDLAMAFYIYGEVPKDMQLVEDEINKISIEKINAKIKLMPIALGSWNQQSNLMLSSGEKLDLIALRAALFSGYVSKGQIIELDDLLDKYGQGIKQALGDYLSAGKINGKTYGVTTVRDLAISLGILMKKSYVEKYNIDTSKIKTLDDVEAIFKTVKSQEPEITPLIPFSQNNSFIDILTPNDTLGDSFGVLLNKGEELKVVNWYETPEYAEMVNLMRKWYNAGYIMKDAATTKESYGNLMKSNKGFSYFCRLKPGIDNQESITCGEPIVSVTLVDPYTNTSIVQTLQWGIALNSEAPDKAMQFLNLMYTDADIVNLLDWGIEGKHYVKTTDGTIDFPEGIDATNSGYNLNMGWVFGNQTISHLWKGNSLDLWKQYIDFNNNAVKSKAFGFAFDSSSVKTEIAALTSVVSQYKLGLETGALDPEMLPEFISKLKTAGIDTVIAEKQRQLDDWAKNNK